MPAEDRQQIPELVKLAEKVNPLIVRGDQYCLALPDDSNWPAVMYFSEDGSQGVLFVYQMQDRRSSLDPPFDCKAWTTMRDINWIAGKSAVDPL